MTPPDRYTLLVCPRCGATVIRAGVMPAPPIGRVPLCDGDLADGQALTLRPEEHISEPMVAVVIDPLGGRRAQALEAAVRRVSGLTEYGDA